VRGGDRSSLEGLSGGGDVVVSENIINVFSDRLQ